MGGGIAEGDTRGERKPRNSKRSQGRQKIRWRDEIVTFAGAGWSTLTSDREKWKGLERPL